MSGYEKKDLPPRSVALFVVLIVGTLIVGLGLSVVIMEQTEKLEHSFHVPDHPLASVQPRPEPALQVHPTQQLLDHEANVNRELNTYGWVDESNGIVRIPIERAMDLMVSEGFQVRQ